MNVLAVDKKLLGKTFKQDQKKVLAALEALSEDEDESVRWSGVVVFVVCFGRVRFDRPIPRC